MVDVLGDACVDQIILDRNVDCNARLKICDVGAVSLNLDTQVLNLAAKIVVVRLNFFKVLQKL